MRSKGLGSVRNMYKVQARWMLSWTLFVDLDHILFALICDIMFADEFYGVFFVLFCFVLFFFLVIFFLE